MAKADKREPVTARGIELLVMIAEAPEGYLALTQEEGADAVNAGYAALDTSVTDVPANTAAVRLTDAGKAEVTSGQDKPQASGFNIRADIPLPTASGRGRGRRATVNPFDNLEVGQSFHVKKNKPDDDVAARMASTLSNARRKHSEEIPGEFETVTQKTIKRDEAGKRVKDAEGHFVVEKTEDVQVPKRKQLRDFVIANVGADDPDGEGARVWRKS